MLQSAAAEEDGDTLSLAELISNAVLLLFVGHETTTNLLGNGLIALLRNPTQLKLFSERPDLAEHAVEEILRTGSVTTHFRRTATRDTEVRGQKIAEGDKVVLWFVSGNRDETVFDAPHSPQLDRSPNPNVAFGQGGPHFCLGMWLARLEVKVVLQALAGRLSSIEALEPPRWTILGNCTRAD